MQFRACTDNVTLISQRAPKSIWRQDALRNGNIMLGVGGKFRTGAAFCFPGRVVRAWTCSAICWMSCSARILRYVKSSKLCIWYYLSPNFIWNTIKLSTLHWINSQIHSRTYFATSRLIYSHLRLVHKNRVAVEFPSRLRRGTFSQQKSCLAFRDLMPLRTRVRRFYAREAELLWLFAVQIKSRENT